jgi:hypothetical protein
LAQAGTLARFMSPMSAPPGPSALPRQDVDPSELDLGTSATASGSG